MIDPQQPDYTNTPVAPQRPAFEYSLAVATAPPVVTVVTPFYNTGEIFHETAHSVLQQSWQQWEWLIVNDGSTESDALTVLARYRQRDPRIQVLDHAHNRGLSAARNTGFQAARTAYVVQLDSDDLLEPTALEKWLWYLESHPESAFVKGYTVGFDSETYLWTNGFHDGDAFLKENLVAPSSMMRSAVCRAVGGYDESNRAGLEDWDFWLRCANHGYWGGTVPEYLDWYRRRPTHQDRWTNWDHGPRQQAFRQQLRRQYPRLWQGAFPQPVPAPHLPNATLSETTPGTNLLRKGKPRLLMLVPWLTVGGADKFNLDVLAQLTQRGWEVTIATTLPGDHAWLPLFARHTPDILPLPHFLRLLDYPRFLRYLIQSRQVDVVMLSNSELGYHLLPYLRAHCPEVAWVDFCHIEEEHWKNGGYPRLAVAHQALLDLNLVASAHLQRWMVQQGAEVQRIRVCHINVDADTWCPEPATRQRVRQELGLDAATPVLLYAARLCEQKQPQVFAHTMRQLARLESRVLALVAGDGPDLAWLQQFVQRQRLSQHVRLLGAVPNARVRELMQAADVFFLPSQWEGIALSIYEAMACGLPIVGADVGGQRELVTPECGVLLRRADAATEAAQYAAVLAELLGQPQRRQQMGQQGRVRVAGHFRLEHMGACMVRLLEEARQLHRSQPRPRPSSTLGHLCATRAVEYFRLSAVSDALWWEHTQRQPARVAWRTRVYFALKRVLLPYYRLALQRRIRWLVPLKERLKQALLR